MPEALLLAPTSPLSEVVTFSGVSFTVTRLASTNPNLVSEISFVANAMMNDIVVRCFGISSSLRAMGENVNLQVVECKIMQKSLVLYS